jgi:hypothetical protein
MSSGGPMKLSLTAAVAAVLVTSLAYYASAFGSSSVSTQRGRRQRDSDDYYEDVPPEILQNDNDADDFICDCKEELILAVRIAQEGESLYFVMVIVCAFSCS